MNETDLPTLITELIALDRAIAEQTELLTAGKTVLINAAIEEHNRTVGSVPTKGCSYSFTGSCGSVACVMFPEDKLITSFRIEGDQAIKGSEKAGIILGPFKKICGESFSDLFNKLYKPVKAFREIAPRLLTPGAANKLIDACQEPSSPRVAFKTKEA